MLSGAAPIGSERQQRGGLRHRLEDQHARHHRAVREMADEERLVDRDVLERLDALARFDLEHPVDQQERVAVRQLLEYFVDVHHVLLLQGLHALAQPVQLLERGGVLFPGRIVVDGKDAGVVAGLRMERVTRENEEMCTLSASVRWPRMPALPPMVQCAPMVALPATPTQPAMAVCLPMRTLCADLDQVVELHAVLDHRVAQRARSMQVLAPISTSLPMRTAPSCSIFSHAPAFGREAETVRADHHAGMDDAALAHHAALADRHPRLQHVPAPIVRAALDHAQRADAGRGVDDRIGIDDGAGMDRRARLSARLRCFHSCVSRAKYR